MHTPLRIYAGFDQIPLSWGVYSIFVIVLYVCLTVVHWTLKTSMHTTRPVPNEPHWLMPIEDLAHRQKINVIKQIQKIPLFYCQNNFSTRMKKMSALDPDLHCATNYNIPCFPAKMFSKFYYWHHCYFLELSQCFPNFCFSHFTVRCLSL